MQSRIAMSWKQYHQELMVHGNKYASMDKVNTTITPERLSRLENIFVNTSQAELPLIAIGPSQKLWMPSVLHNFGGASDKPFKSALNTKYASPTWKQEPSELIAHEALKQKLNKEPDYLRNGNIIIEANWGLAENDAFIIGAMDSRKEVHVATKAKMPSEIDDIDLWSDDYGLSVLGHELVLALSSGFKPVEHSYNDLGMVLLGERPFEYRNLGESLDVRKDISKGKVDDLRKFFEEAQAPKRFFSFPNSSSSSGGGSSALD